MEITSESKLLLFIQMLVFSTPIQSTNYVKSNNSSLHNCPGSCLTLDEYINDSMRYFTTGSIFIFLPGNHSQQNALSISNISSMIWRGNNSGLNDVIILSSGSLHCYNVTDFTIEGLKFVRLTNVPVFAFTRSAILLFSLNFQSNTGNMATAERAVQLNHSNITIINTSFEGIRGGAVMATDNSTLTLIDTAFIGNEAPPKGHKNSGGAIYCVNSIINMTGKNFLNENRANYKGGAVNIRNGSLIITGIANFSENEAKDGGALYLSESHALINGTDINFIKNVAENGGGLYVTPGKMAKTNIFISANFIENFGPVSAIILRNGIITFRNVNIKSNENVALLIQRSQVEFRGTNSFSKNNGINSTQIKRILYITDSTVTFNGNTMIKENIIQNGVVGAMNSKIFFNGSTNFLNNQGGIILRDSSMEFSGNTSFYNNSALTNGGAISSENGTLSFRGSTSFISNKAQIDGGALYALKTEVTLYGTANFSSNAAQSGGAMYLTSGATLFIASILNVSHNNATDYGGAIFHRDIVTPIQCNERISKKYEPMEFPNCFLQFDSRTQQARIESYQNLAGKGGNFLYGGLLDMCWLSKGNPESKSSPYDTLLSKGYIRILSQDDTLSTEKIESEPLRLCFCYNNSFHHDCSNMKSIEIQRGQELDVSLVAIGQGWSIVHTDIIALGKNIIFKHNQTLQVTSRQCSSLRYSLYSNSDHGKLVLYPNGPCRDTGLAKIVVQVTFLPCPDGFRQNDEECVCDERLEEYDAQCIIGKENHFIKRKETDTFWMSMLKSANDSYLGLILYHSCPADYCTSDTVDIPLDNLDTQCASHRTGVLCGQCSDNYSLKLGSSRCGQCSNHYLGLLIPFALAGIVLIAFLSVFRLTVAYGMINSLILYANIVQVNRRQFFPTDVINVLTVFIAWLNLDLGIETCFFNGLDAYIQTWLQFAFPFYIWILIGLIILTSRYSMTVSKLIGTNPIAVLATLLLMSYSRILQVIIDVYTFARLDYPDGKKFAWWKDGNVPYLYQKHLLLVIFTSFVIIFFFLPYTLLLLFGPCLYRIPEGKCSRWLNRIKPLLDSYYAPYKENTCYWTGFLLLVRCALYIVVTFSQSHDDYYNSFAAIIIMFSGILSINWITGKIYNKTCISLIEGSIYLNLILLSVLSQKGTGLATVYALVGIVFVTMIGIILYQFHHLYFKKVTDWMMKKISLIYRRKSINFINRKETGNDNVISPTISLQNVSQTVIELREPLLEN